MLFVRPCLPARQENNNSFHCGGGVISWCVSSSRRLATISGFLMSNIGTVVLLLGFYALCEGDVKRIGFVTKEQGLVRLDKRRLINTTSYIPWKREGWLFFFNRILSAI